MRTWKDKARREADKKLAEIERGISELYATDPALRRMRKEYNDFMSKIADELSDAWDAYDSETDEQKKRELKDEYIKKARRLTLQSKEYKRIVDKITSELARVNQEALDMVNDEMLYIYKISYNQVAEKCKKVGINVRTP